jgi:hypothetical protein
LCAYDPKEVVINTASNNGKNKVKKIIRLSLEGEYLDEFKSIKEAAKLFKTQSTSIINVCKNKYKTAGGYKWMYKDDYEKYINKVG